MEGKGGKDKGTIQVAEKVRREKPEKGAEW